MLAGTTSISNILQVTAAFAFGFNVQTMLVIVFAILLVTGAEYRSHGMKDTSIYGVMNFISILVLIFTRGQIIGLIVSCFIALLSLVLKINDPEVR